MENDVNPGAERVILQLFEEIVFVPVILKLQPAQIFIIRAVFEIIDNQNIRAPAAIEFFHDVAADETGPTRYDKHKNSSSF